MIIESGYLLKFPECLDFSVDEKSPVENGISNFGCQTTPVNDLHTQVSGYISRNPLSLPAGFGATLSHYGLANPDA